MLVKSPLPWYRNGLAFSCQGCGRCCSGPEEGYVWVTNEDIRAMAARLEMPMAAFKKKYVRRIGVRMSLLEKQPTKDCVLLAAREKGQGCLTYQERPIQCRTWPFWKENLKSPQTWAQTALKCPGIDQGQWHSCERIETILMGKLDQAPKPVDFWLMIKAKLADIQAAPACFKLLEELYQNLDRQIEAANPSCQNCGQCCSFKQFGHKLYTTTLETLYFLHGLEQSQTKIKKTADGKCPYQTQKGCIMRPYRPAGCRIFFCKDLPADYQQEVTENTLRILRQFHNDFAIPYLYADFLTWLSRLA